MISLILLICIIFIINMVRINTKDNIKLNKYIKYVYVPKSIYEYQFNKIDLLDKYDNIFTKDDNIIII